MRLQSAQLCPSTEISLGLFILPPMLAKLLGTRVFDTATFLSNLVELANKRQRY